MRFKVRLISTVYGTVRFVRLISTVYGTVRFALYKKNQVRYIQHHCIQFSGHQRNLSVYTARRPSILFWRFQTWNERQLLQESKSCSQVIRAVKHEHNHHVAEHETWHIYHTANSNSIKKYDKEPTTRMSRQEINSTKLELLLFLCDLGLALCSLLKCRHFGLFALRCNLGLRDGRWGFTYFSATTHGAV